MYWFVGWKEDWLDSVFGLVFRNEPENGTFGNPDTAWENHLMAWHWACCKIRNAGQLFRETHHF